MTREYWWNTDFDLALQPGWHPDLDANLAGQIRQFENHALLAARPADTVLLSRPIPDDFLDYLQEHGVETPGLSVMPTVDSSARFTPYGWSPQAIALRGRYDNPEPYPRLEVVRRVNGRRFGHRIETEILGSKAPVGSFSSLGGLGALLDGESDRSDGWVVKTEHGNAALGNRRIRSRSLTDADRRWVDARLERGPMVLERWFPRTIDLSVVFDLAEDGATGPIAVHETVHTSDGGVIGALFSADRPDLECWRSRLENTASTVSKALFEAGYFGPVCLDALVWSTEGRSELRPVVEINARRHAGEGWSRVAGIWGGTVYGRFYTTRRLQLPEDYAAFESSLGDDAWQVRSRVGALLTSPLWIESATGRTVPLKLGILFRGETRAEVLAMDARFRARFER